MKLVIVESPAKAKKIASFLGEGWRVEASRGHIRDLPRTELGVDVAHDFRPSYELLPRKGNLVRRLMKAAKDAEAIYLATDPDREGEAIAWHFLQMARLPKDKPVYRSTFTAITKQAVLDALNNPRQLDTALVEAQQTRRIVDRLVGYLVSPLACKALDGRLSAGRVQSVCLRLVVEREREIEGFTAQTYWTLAVELDADGQSFKANLHRIKNTSPQFSSLKQANKIAGLLKNAQVWVAKAGQHTKARKPLPPFTTSSLQQTAAKGLSLSPERTMQLAQMLYEAGLITYHRTDGVSVAQEAQQAAGMVILRQYGEQYLPEKPPVYKTKSANAQEAHEAIRPTDVNHLPDAEKGEGAALYELIWQRFVASQMANATYIVTAAILHAGQSQQKPFPLELRAQGRELAFDGFLRVYEEPADDGEDEDNEDAATVPVLIQGQMLEVVDVPVTEKQTRPPACFTEAMLVQTLEKQGIGRPSTFASTVKVLKDRKYVKLSKKRIEPSDLGLRLNDFLVEQFPEVFAYDYTAKMEAQLDEIASGDSTRLATLQTFWKDFQPVLGKATEATLAQMKARPQAHPIGETCPDCGGDLLQREGKNGAFIGCSNYPTCSYTRAVESKPLVLRPAVEE